MTIEMRQSIAVGVGGAIGSIVADILGIRSAATSQAVLLQTLGVGVAVGVTWFLVLTLRRKEKSDA